MGAPLLHVSNVSHALNGKRILDNVSWAVKRGEHWAILGPNRAGKPPQDRLRIPLAERRRKGLPERGIVERHGGLAQKHRLGNVEPPGRYTGTRDRP